MSRHSALDRRTQKADFVTDFAPHCTEQPRSESDGQRILRPEGRFQAVQALLSGSFIGRRVTDQEAVLPDPVPILDGQGRDIHSVCPAPGGTATSSNPGRSNPTI